MNEEYWCFLESFGLYFAYLAHTLVEKRLSYFAHFTFFLVLTTPFLYLCPKGSVII